MKRFLLFITYVLLPSIVFADVAGPVLTKDQACQQKDGASMNRLQILLNGKKSDTLYFFKQDKKLYYIVPMFLYPYVKVDQYGYKSGPYTYAAAMFLYEYNCTTKEPKLLTTQNLKKLIKDISSWWDNNTHPEPATPDFIREIDYGQVTSVTSTGITLFLSITQQPYQAIIFIKK